MFVLFALVQAAPYSHALSGQRNKVAPSWLLVSDFPGLDARLSSIAWTSDTSAALSGQPMHSRRRSLAAQPRVCRAIRLHNTATSPILKLDPLYRYMRPFELARTVNVRSSCWDPTTEHYIDLPYAASLWVSGRIITSPAESCYTMGHRANDHAQVLEPTQFFTQTQLLPNSTTSVVNLDVAMPTPHTQ